MTCKRGRPCLPQRGQRKAPQPTLPSCHLYLQKHKGQKTTSRHNHRLLSPTSLSPLPSEATHPDQKPPTQILVLKAVLPGEGALPTPASVWDASLEPEAADLKQARGTVGCTRPGLP